MKIQILLLDITLIILTFPERKKDLKKIVIHFQNNHLCLVGEGYRLLTKKLVLKKWAVYSHNDNKTESGEFLVEYHLMLGGRQDKL